MWLMLCPHILLCFLCLADSTVHNPRAPPSPRSDAKTAGRRTSAPPIVDTQSQQQRVLLREKSKENQLDRNGRRPVDKERERSGLDIGMIRKELGT